MTDGARCRPTQATSPLPLLVGVPIGVQTPLLLGERCDQPAAEGRDVLDYAAPDRVKKIATIPNPPPTAISGDPERPTSLRLVWSPVWAVRSVGEEAERPTLRAAVGVGLYVGNAPLGTSVRRNVNLRYSQHSEATPSDAVEVRPQCAVEAFVLHQRPRSHEVP